MLTPGTVLLHDTLDPAGENLLFTAPRQTLVAHTADEARAALARLQAAQAEGLHAAGYLAYELGFLFEERLAPSPARAQRYAPALDGPLRRPPAPDPRRGRRFPGRRMPAPPARARRYRPRLDLAGL